MSFIEEILGSIPVYVLIAAAALLLLIIIGIVIILVLRNLRFRRELNEALDNDVNMARRFSPFYVRTRSNVLVRMAREQGSSRSIELSGLGAIWISDFVHHPREKTLRRILEFIPHRGLFPVLQAALKKPSMVRQIQASAAEHGMRTVALSCGGEGFDAAANLEVFRDQIDEIREIAGDPEWNARYFAIKILLEDGSDRSLRPVLDALKDSHPLVRKTVLLRLEEGKVDDLYDILLNSLMHDAAYEVRQAAWQRIQKDYLDRHSFNLEQQGCSEAYHLVDFLDSSRDDHVNLAISLLDSDNLELRHPAAVFLNQSGWLLKTLNEADFADEADLERRLRLLSAAAEVQVVEFLYHTETKPASIFLALKLLETRGDRSLVPPLAERAFTGFPSGPDRIWEQGVLLLNTRISDSGNALLLREMDRNRHSDRKIRFILKNLSIRDDRRIADMLISLLVDQKFPARDALVEACARMEVSMFLPDIKRIVRAERNEFPHEVRINALQILASYRLPYLVQMILEMLPTLPLDEARDFAGILKGYAGADFSSRVDSLLEQPDGKIRAAVIASVPLDEKKRIVKTIRAALKDAEPEVRIAAVWALIELEETRTINQSLDLLRDPVGRVREAAARAMGSYGSDNTLDELLSVIKDENEVDDVRIAAVKGLGESESVRAVAILVGLLSTAEPGSLLFKPVKAALAASHSGRRIAALMEQLKDAEADLRDRIVDVFVLMGPEIEQPVKELLEEELLSLKPYLVEILEQTGFVESMIRRLSDRNPSVRRDAAEFLALIGSLSAFRGIVLAARDPDEDVRVQVTRALEHLASEKGHELLVQLQQDPQMRVRRYTAWALQRLQAKSNKD